MNRMHKIYNVKETGDYTEQNFQTEFLANTCHLTRSTCGAEKLQDFVHHFRVVYTEPLSQSQAQWCELEKDHKDDCGTGA